MVGNKSSKNSVFNLGMKRKAGQLQDESEVVKHKPEGSINNVVPMEILAMILQEVVDVNVAVCLHVCKPWRSIVPKNHAPKKSCFCSCCIERILVPHTMGC